MKYAVKINCSMANKKILNLNLACQAGEIWCLLGANGSGKTTLLHALAGLTSSPQNVIKFNEENILSLSYKQRAQIIGVLLQDQIVPFSGTVKEAIIAARYPYHTLWKKNDDEKYAEKILQLMHLSSLKNRLLNELSGGEQQRLHIAMLLAQDPAIYILDEPTNHLDLNKQMQIIKLLKSLAHEKRKIIITVMHDLNLIYQFADYVCFIYEDGQIEQGKTQELFCEEKLENLFQHKIKKIMTKEENVIWLAD